ncbi:SLBB domain-containing protein [Schleiferiaceae bacterium]|nr:SLBB domain-containing protein [Schleiferiaceae bacterium]
MKLMRTLLWAMVLIPALLSAQPSQEEARRMARTEASRQGVDPDELERRLQARGINTATLTMTDIPRIQPIVEEEIAKMKAEQSSTKDAIESGSLSGTAMSSKGGEQKESSIQTTTVELASDANTVTKTKTNDGGPVQVKVDASTENTMVFGKHIFANGSLSLYEVSKDYIPNDSYILGPGDVVTVSIFGKSQADLQFTIKSDGFIEPANLPKIYLKGISLGQAREVVRRRLQNFYQFEKGQFALTLTTSRTLTIQITGAVAQPGSYTLSAYNTAFNALIAAGGPNKLGTIRNIQVINGGRSKTLDVYEYLFNPSKQKDYYLQNNDIIYVPFIGDLIEIEGSVKQVGVYEMQAKETFTDLLKYSGGYLNDALEGEIQLVRKNADGSFVKEYNGDALSSLTFEDGDKVIVATQTSDRKDYVEVGGLVDYPGVYGIKDYPTLKTLLEKVGLRDETRLDVGYLTRLRSDGTTQLESFSLTAVLAGEIDMALQAEDVIKILDSRNYVDRSTVSISGEVRNPGSYTIDENVTIPALIDLSDGLTQEAKQDAAYIFRTYPNGETEVIAVSLDDAEFSFQDKDQLRILSERTFYDGAVISISGEVKIPLEIPFDQDISLREVVELAGGLTFAGDSTQLVVYRMAFEGLNIGELQEIPLNLSRDGDFIFSPFDALVVRRKFGFEFQEFVSIKGEVAYPGRYALKEGETVKDLIRKAGGLTSEAFPQAATFQRQGKGRIFISIEKILRSGGSYENIEMLPGDQIIIPTKDLTVEIRLANTEAANYGSFAADYASASVNVAFVAGKSARWYVKNMVGGFGDDAKRTDVNVVYANGSVKDFKWRRLKYRYPKVKPGAMVVVGAKPIKEKETGKRFDSDFDWQEFSGDLLSQISAVFTVVILANQL